MDNVATLSYIVTVFRTGLWQAEVGESWTENVGASELRVISVEVKA